MTAPAVVAGAVIALAAGTPAFEPPRFAAARAEQRALCGTWVATAGVRDGTAIPKDDLARVRLTFGVRPNDPTALTADLRGVFPDPAARTASVVVLAWRTPARFQVCRYYSGCGLCVEGLYERDGDTLRLCVNPRLDPASLTAVRSPTAFAAPAGSGLTLLTLKREK